MTLKLFKDIFITKSHQLILGSLELATLQIWSSYFNEAQRSYFLQVCKSKNIGVFSKKLQEILMSKEKKLLCMNHQTSELILFNTQTLKYSRKLFHAHDSRNTKCKQKKAHKPQTVKTLQDCNYNVIKKAAKR